MIAPALKTKRHYNSFSPRAKFFTHLGEVRAWFDEAVTVPQQQLQYHLGKVSKKTLNHVNLVALIVALLIRSFDGRALLGCCQMPLVPEEFEPSLKNPLECFHCDLIAKNMPALKKHLQEEFDALRKREVRVAKSKKRKCEVVDVDVESTSDRKGKGKKVTRVS